MPTETSNNEFLERTNCGSNKKELKDTKKGILRKNMAFKN